MDKRILVLGVGNILLRDEGAGVRTVELLLRDFDFPESVTLLDGGTLGMRLMDAIMASDYLIVADAVLGGDKPGTIYRLTGDDLRKSLAFKNSLHQNDLVETLVYCEILGSRPEAVIIGIEPEDYTPWSDVMTDTVAGRIPDLARAVLNEIEAAGGSYHPKG